MARIMVVDDVQSLREMLGAAVRSLKHEAILCASAVEAAKALKDPKSFDLILLDIELEDGNGIELMKMIKSLRDEKKLKTKVCFVSGSRDKETIMKAIQSGGDDYILKPIDPKTFKNKVGSLLNEELTVSEPIFALPVQLKANLFESPIPAKLLVKLVSTRDFIFESDVAFEIKKTVDLAIPTLGNHLGYKGTFRGDVTKCEKIKDQLFRVSIQLHSLATLGLDGKLKALCAKGVQLNDIVQSEEGKKDSEKPASSLSLKPKNSLPSVNSLAMNALASLNKKSS
jgi:CheY-like chemotaxis protein